MKSNRFKNLFNLPCPRTPFPQVFSGCGGSLAVALILFQSQPAEGALILYQGFEGSDTWSYTSTGGGVSSTTGSGDTPANQRIESGSYSFQVINGSASLTFASADISSYTDVYITLRLSSTSTTTGNGADAGDYVRLFTNLDGAGFATNAAANADISLEGFNNARYGYNATLTATTNAGTNLQVTATGGNSNTNYSTLRINLNDATNTVGLMISLLNNNAAEVWNIDSISLWGDLILAGLDWTGDGAGAVWTDGAAGHFAGDYENDLGNTVTFTGDAETVTVSGEVEAGSLSFSTAGYTLEGSGTLELGTGGVSTVEGITTIDSVLTGDGGLTKTGAGTLVLGGGNDFSGAVQITAGTVRITDGAALGTTGSGTTVSSGAALELAGGITTLAEPLAISGTGVGGNGALRNFSGNNEFTGAITLNAASRIQSDAGLLTLSGGISSGNHNLTFGGSGDTTVSAAMNLGGGSLTKGDAGTLTLAAANTYSGGTTITGGTVLAGVNGALGSGAVTVGSGGSLTINGSSSHTNTTITGGTVLAGAAGALGSGAVSISSGSLTINDSSSHTNTTITGGTVLAGTAGALGSGAVSISSGSLTINGSSGHTNTTVSGGTVVAAANGALGSGAVSVSNGSLTINGSNTYSGGTMVSGGTVFAGADGALAGGDVVMSGGSILGGANVTTSNVIVIGTAPSTTTGVIAGWDFNGLTSFGASPQAANTVAEGVTVGGLTRGSGVTTTGSGSAAGNAWGGNGFASTSSSAAISANDFVTFSLTSTGGPLTLSSIDAYNVRRSGSGPTTGLWQYQIGSGEFTDLGSAITWGTNTATAGNGQSAISLGSAFDDIAAGTTVTFRLVNYNGDVGGNWYLNNFQAGNDFTISGDILVAGTGTGTLGIATAGTTTFDGDILVNNTATLTAAEDGTAIFEGVISGPGAVTKTGAGTVTLEGENTYTGLTTVSAGTLNVIGSVASAVTVKSGATLDGHGTIGGAAIIEGNHVAGSGSIGTQEFSSGLIYATGSSFTWDLDLTGLPVALVAGEDFDFIDITGALSVAEGTTFNIVVAGSTSLGDEFWLSDHSWDVFAADSYSGGFTDFVLYTSSMSPVNYTDYGYFTFDNSGTLSWTAEAVPEPGNALAGLLIAAGLCRRYRGRGRKKPVGGVPA